MTTRSLEDLANSDFLYADRETEMSVSKEVNANITSSAMDKILGSIATLSTTMASRLQTFENRQEEDRKRQEEDRKRQEWTDRALEEVIAVSRESERRTMDVLRTVLDRQRELEDELDYVQNETAYDHPDRVGRSFRSDRPVDSRQESGFPLDPNPPTSKPPLEFELPCHSSAPRRSERLRRRKELDDGRPNDDYRIDPCSDLEEIDITLPSSGAFRGQTGQAWIRAPGSPDLAIGQVSSKYQGKVLPRGSQFHAAGGEVSLDGEGWDSLEHHDSRGGLSNPIGNRAGPALGQSRRPRGSQLHEDDSDEASYI